MKTFEKTFEEELIHELTQPETGAELVNVKFLLGDNRYITKEQLCEQAYKILEQDKKGALVVKKNIDSHLEQMRVTEFLSIKNIRI